MSNLCGYPNEATYQFASWLEFDDTHRFAEKAATLLRSHLGNTQAATQDLAEYMKAWLWEWYPLDDGLYDDLLKVAIGQVNFSAVARAYVRRVAEIHEKNKEMSK